VSKSIKKQLSALQQLFGCRLRLASPLVGEMLATVRG